VGLPTARTRIPRSCRVASSSALPWPSARARHDAAARRAVLEPRRRAARAAGGELRALLSRSAPRRSSDARPAGCVRARRPRRPAADGCSTVGHAVRLYHRPVSRFAAEFVGQRHSCRVLRRTRAADRARPLVRTLRQRRVRREVDVLLRRTTWCTTTSRRSSAHRGARVPRRGVPLHARAAERRRVLSLVRATRTASASWIGVRSRPTRRHVSAGRQSRPLAHMSRGITARHSAVSRHRQLTRRSGRAARSRHEQRAAEQAAAGSTMRLSLPSASRRVGVTRPRSHAAAH